MKNILAFLCFVTAFSLVTKAQYARQRSVTHHPAGAMLPTKAAKQQIAGDPSSIISALKTYP